MIMFRNLKASMRQTIALNIFPSCYIGTDKGLVGSFYGHLAINLNIMYRLFSVSVVLKALRNCSKFFFLAAGYSSLITTSQRMVFDHTTKHFFRKCR